MRKQPRDEEAIEYNETDHIKELFEKIENETNEAFKKLAVDQSKGGSGNNSNIVTNANMLRLHEICLLKKWEKIKPESIRDKVSTEQNVIRTDWLTEAELLVPLDSRKITNARFFLYLLKQEGLFSDIYNIEVFSSEATKQQFMLCSTVTRRIDEKSILTGDYVFQLVDNHINWNSDNVEDKVKFVDGICKINHDGPKIFSERVIFRNFYFNIVNHSAANPLLSINFL